MKKNNDRPNVMSPIDDLNRSSSHLSLKLNFFKSRSKSEVFLLSASLLLEPLRTLRAGLDGLDLLLLKSSRIMLISKTKVFGYEFL
jgi:hypothetical protein